LFSKDPARGSCGATKLAGATKLTGASSLLERVSGFGFLQLESAMRWEEVVEGRRVMFYYMFILSSKVFMFSS